MFDNEKAPRLLRVEEAAEFLNIKPSTVRAWLLRRKLPFVRVGLRAVRIPLEALERLISESTIPAREQQKAKPFNLHAWHAAGKKKKSQRKGNDNAGENPQHLSQ